MATKSRNEINGALGGEKIKQIRSGKTYEEIYGVEKAKLLREKLSKVHKGKINSERKGKTLEEYYGKKLAKQTKEKIRKGVLKDFVVPKTCWKKGHIPHNKGKTYEEIYSKEKANKLKEDWKRKVRNNIKLPLKDSKPELLMQSYLDKLNITYVKHKYIKNIKHGYQCDIFIEPNIVIEVDGIYWHKYPKGRTIDNIRTNELKENGYKVFRFWEGMFDFNLVRNQLKGVCEC